MPLKIQVLRSHHDGSVRVQIPKQASERCNEILIAEIEENDSGYNTLSALLSADNQTSDNLRLALESLCLKMFDLGTHEARQVQTQSCPTSPPP